MIAVCRKCRQLFETTLEDAYDPDGAICAPCYHAGRRSQAARRGETYTVPVWVKLDGDATQEDVHHD